MCFSVNNDASKLLQEFPPTSKLDPEVNGDQNSTIAKEHIENNIDGLTIEEVMFLVSFIPHNTLGMVVCSCFVNIVS